jgi:hypothetical protein
MPMFHEQNPFVLPGMSQVHQALDPNDQHRVEEDYVQVDHSLEAFASFQKEAVSAEALARGGRLVVVTGNDRTGKTSVLKRCEHWVRTGLTDSSLAAEKRLEPAFIDLSLGKPGDLVVADSLVGWVTKRVIQILENKRIITQEQSERWLGWDAPDRLEAVGDWLTMNNQNQSHRASVGALLIELPPQTTSALLSRFAQLSHPYVILFAEYAPTERSTGSWWEEGEMARPGPIEVKVGELQPQDCGRFVNQRLQRHDIVGQVPTLAADVEVELEQFRNRLSIGMLQKWMFFTYEAALAEQPRPAELSWVYLMERFIDLSLRGGRENG